MKNKKIFALAVIAILTISLFIPFKNAFASYKYNEWNVNIDVLQNGNLNIREDVILYFGSHDGGKPYHWYKRQIDLNKIGGIENVKVFEYKNSEEVPYRLGEGTPGTFRAYREGNSAFIKINFEAKDTVKHFVITYTVTGAAKYGTIAFYEKDTLFHYYAIPSGNEVPIEKANVTVNLPKGATKDEIKAWGFGLPVGTGKVTIVSGNKVTFQAQDIAPGQFIGVSIVMPKGLILMPEGVKVYPGSAKDILKKQAEENARRAKIAGLKTLIGFLLFLFIVVFMFFRWYTKGREYKVPKFAEYVREPPSNIPPAVVGALLKQGATIKEVLATIIDLANRGYLTMEEIKGGLLRSTDYVYTLNREKDTENLKPFEKQLLEYMFGVLNTVRLSDLKYNFANYLPKLYKLIDRELVENGFYEGGDPAKVKATYFGIGIAMLFVGFFLITFGGFIGIGFLIWPLILGGIVVMLFANAMPRKSLKGMQEREKWLAFERYLKGLLKYKKAEEAKDLFAKYLPFAIIFGIDNRWIKEFSKAKAPAPIWYIPYGYGYNMGYMNNRDGMASTQSFGGGKGAAPSSGLGEGFANPMQGFSLDSVSHGLNSLLNSSAAVFTSTKSSSSGGGGGFSGGGGGFGGGGGGGSSAG